jgi:ketosteroid isomerase-like protein
MRKLAAFLLVLFLTPALHAVSPDPELTKIITDLDRQLFDAYNNCDLEKFKNVFADDVVFYHDEGGVMTGAAPVTEAVKNNICGKVQRVLVSTEVFPMKGFGAVQTGVHRFTHPNRKPDDVGEAKFFHVWQYKDGKWKITQVFSYHHHTADMK